MIGRCIDGVLQRQPRAHGPLGIVFVSDRCAEDDHEAVAHDADHGSAETLHDRSEHRLRAVGHGANVFRIHLLGERCEAGEIAEENGRPAPLDDLVGSGGRLESCSALPAESEVERVRLTAGRARG